MKSERNQNLPGSARARPVASTFWLQRRVTRLWEAIQSSFHNPLYTHIHRTHLPLIMAKKSAVAAAEGSTGPNTIYKVSNTHVAPHECRSLQATYRYVPAQSLPSLPASSSFLQLTCLPLGPYSGV
jgi:hypothetical protein